MDHAQKKSWLIVFNFDSNRSQVVREACLTISFMSQQYQNKMDHFAEAVFYPLINLIPSSAKVSLLLN